VRAPDDSPATVAIAGPTGFAAFRLCIDPGGSHLYVVVLPQDPSTALAAVAQYAIQADGTLAPLSPSYVSVAATGAGALAIDPGGQHAYLAGATTMGGRCRSSRSAPTVRSRR